MARDLSSALAALIASGDCKQYQTLDVLLADGTPLHLSSKPVTVGTTVYQPVLDEVEDAQIGLTSDDDSQEFKAANVDMVLGRTVTGQANLLDGATAIAGTVFVDKATGTAYYDERLPGALLSGEVTDKQLTLDLTDEVYATIIEGKTVDELFPFRPSPPPEDRPNPNDLQPPERPGDEFDPDPGGHGGRYRPSLLNP